MKQSGAYDAARSGALVARLPDVGVVCLAGPDARRFSNGMFTNNVRDLPDGRGNRHAMCDDRGRMLGLLDLYALGGERFLLLLEGVTTAWFESRYAVYIVFDDVELSLLDDREVLTVQGPEAESVCAAVGLSVGADDVGEAGEVVIARSVRGGSDGRDVIVPAADARRWLDALVGAGAVEGGAADLEVLRVEAGRVRWPVDMTDKQLVHEVGLRDVAVSFEKGCYVGQETINRVDVMGQVRKGLVGLRVVGSPAPGSEVLVDGKVVGRVGSVVQSPRFGTIALAVVRTASAEAGAEVSVRDGEATCAAAVAPLPFEP